MEYRPEIVIIKPDTPPFWEVPSEWSRIFRLCLEQWRLDDSLVWVRATREHCASNDSVFLCLFITGPPDKLGPTQVEEIARAGAVGLDNEAFEHMVTNLASGVSRSSAVQGEASGKSDLRIYAHPPIQLDERSYERLLRRMGVATNPSDVDEDTD